MNRKQFTLLLFLVVVVGLAGLLVYLKQNAAREAGNPNIGQKLLGDFPVNDITHIALTEGTNQLDLVKKNDLWCVRERNDYPANYGQISEVLLKLRDLKIGQSEKVGPSQLSRFNLAPGSGSNAPVVVDFKGKDDKSLRTLTLGKEHMRKSNRPSPMGDDMGEGGGWPDGRYVKVGANSDTVDLVSDALSNLKPKAEQWLNKDFFKVEKLRSVAVTYPVASNSFELTRATETGEWKLAEAKPGEQLDSSKVATFSNPFTPNFSDVASGTTPDQIEKPTLVKFETFDQFSYTLRVGPKTNDNYLLAMTVSAQLPKERAPGKDEKPEDKTRLDKEFKDKQQKAEEKLNQEKAYEKWVYLVSSWPLDSVVKERGQLLQEKKEEKKDEKKEGTAGASTNSVATPLEPLPVPEAKAETK